MTHLSSVAGMSAPDGFFTIAIGILWIYLCHLTLKFRPEGFATMARFSKNINTMYLISWCIIAWTSTAILASVPGYVRLPDCFGGEPTPILPEWSGVILGLLWVPVADFLAVRWLNYRSRTRRNKESLTPLNMSDRICRRC